MRWLILVPTSFEREKLTLAEADDVHVEVCGFGLVASAANASRLIARYRPKRVLLCGIAGALNDKVDIGSAYQFKRTALFGVGVGYGASHVSAQQMGWKQFESDDFDIVSQLEFDFATGIANSLTRDLIVSCCSASANPADADILRQRFPQADVEEMEGFAVVTAAKIAATPCHIVRGISNDAGNRDHASWRVDEAMRSVSGLVNEITS